MKVYRRTLFISEEAFIMNPIEVQKAENASPIESKREELVRLFAEAMESGLSDEEKGNIINDLYEIMDIWSSALHV
jgi:hypothetical protein